MGWPPIVISPDTRNISIHPAGIADIPPITAPERHMCTVQGCMIPAMRSAVGL
jgi:hypothetical protein